VLTVFTLFRTTIPSS